jgi:AbiV family abortive infection protein
VRKPPVPKPPPRRAQDEILLGRLSHAAVDNAESLLADAKLLSGQGSFGHAFALAVLAEEELGKANTLWIATMDKTATLTKEGKLFLNGRPYEPFASHKLKQAVQLGPGFLLEQFDPIIAEISKVAEKGPLDADAVINIVDTQMALLSKDQDTFLKAVKPLLELAVLDQEKQDGLYVGYLRDKIKKPSEFSKERCQEVIDRVSLRIGPTRNRIEAGIVPEAEAIFRTLYPLFNKIDFHAFAKKWKRGLPQHQLDKETRKMRKTALDALRKTLRRQIQTSKG